MKSLRHFDNLQQVHNFGLQPRRDALYLADLQEISKIREEELEDSEPFISVDTTILERAYKSVEPAEVAALHRITCQLQKSGQA